MGRPSKPLGTKYRTPARQIGRVSDDNWKIILAGANASGKNKTQWITETLTVAALLLVKKKGRLSRNDNPPVSQE